MNNIAAPLQAQAWSRKGPISTGERGPALICLTGGGDSGKTRLACCAPRACPDRFGDRAVYVAMDPEALSLGSVLHIDRQKSIGERIALNESKDLFSQLKGIYTYDWAKEGFKTIITDTMSVYSKMLHAQLTNSARFSDKNVKLAEGVFLPQQGDYLGTQTLIMTLLMCQKSSGMNHITLFHDQEVHPEAGKPGEHYGGPGTVGKAGVTAIVDWYNTVLHAVKRPKKRANPGQPLEMEYVVHTSSHGIWSAKLRLPTLVNPIPCITMEPDPINVWQAIEKAETETNIS